MMQQLEFEQTEYPHRPLSTCNVCKKLGYQYKRKRGGHYYVYTKHLNEPPIGKYANGKDKYRECYDDGRLYSSMQEALDARNKTIKHIQKIRTPRRLLCPKCGKPGKARSYKDRGKIRFLVSHGYLDGFWGKKSKVAKEDRCWIAKPEHIQFVAKKLAHRGGDAPIAERRKIKNGKKITCPKCNKLGKFCEFDNGKRVMVTHGKVDGKPKRCHLNKDLREWMQK